MDKSLIDFIYEKAAANPQRIVFPEATDEKILLAVRKAMDLGVFKPLLLGNPVEITAAAKGFGISLEGAELVDAGDEAWLDNLIESYCAENPMNTAKSMKRKAAENLLYPALMMVGTGDADTMCGGFTHSSRDFHVAAVTLLGMEEGIDTISSVLVADIPNFNGSEGHWIIFGDCAVCANPTSEQLAGIAICTCDMAKKLLGWEPRCALTSYSTIGSGAGAEPVDKVVEAVRIAQERRPDLAIDGEFQFDAAVNEMIAAKKVNRESRVAGRANIVILPNLDTGNIGVKMIQAFSGGLDCYIVMMGLKKTVTDCSRSSSVMEIVGNASVACILAQERG